VDPTGLAAGASYSGTVTVQGTGAAAGSSPSSIGVTLMVTAPFPTIASVQSAAILGNGPAGMVSPGEMVTIFGTSLGPATALQTALDPTTHKVSSNLGGVQVLFNGYAAPLTYVSATQINCVVPYELAQVSNPYLQVKFAGQPSNAYNLTLAATLPGIFTVNSAGSGQGAILNADSTYNGTGTGFLPAAAGSVIQVYMTGEGQTSPAGVTGQVNCPSGSPCTLAQIPVPVLPVAALVNGQPASVVFWGEAPGIVSGIMQVNLIIPPGTPSGPASLVIKVGSASSQAGVTVAVQ
jgi:trimeric autotransporter adhesin